MDPAILWVALPTAAAVLIVTAILLYLYNSGIFTSPEVDVGTPRIRDATIMYKISKGPYQNAGPAFEAIAKLAPKKCLIGLYYDDPDTVSMHYLCQFWGSVADIYKYLHFFIV